MKIFLTCGCLIQPDSGFSAWTQKLELNRSHGHNLLNLTVQLIFVQHLKLQSITSKPLGHQVPKSSLTLLYYFSVTVYRPGSIDVIYVLRRKPTPPSKDNEAVDKMFSTFDALKEAIMHLFALKVKQGSLGHFQVNKIFRFMFRNIFRYIFFRCLSLYWGRVLVLVCIIL